MKKFIAVIAGVLTVVCLSVLLAACGSTNVDGKTYVYESVSVTAPEGTSQDMIDQIKSYFEMEGTTFAFADGKVTIVTDEDSETYDYEQNGSEITIKDVTTDEENPTKFKVDGKKLLMEMTNEGFSIVVTFVQQ